MPERELKLPVQTREVISYEDDVYAWVYLDQLDHVLRYEAYVVGYDTEGTLSTLELVLEEGALEAATLPLLPQFLAGAQSNAGAGSQDGLAVRNVISHPAAADRNQALLDWYRRLAPRQLRSLHRFFEQQESELKRRHRGRWIKRLRALGYDVVSSL